MRPRLAAMLALWLTPACTGDRTIIDTSEATSTDGGSGTGSETGEETDTELPDPDLPAEDPCDCDEGSLCVADCLWDATFGANVDNFRCIGPPDCSGESDDPMCVVEACGYSVATTSCDGKGDGIDIVCDPYFEEFLCDSRQQDCPVDEKCVLKVWGWEQAHESDCTEVTGAAAVGEGCSSQGALDGADDCDGEGMCWSGAVDFEPFQGTCHRFCDLAETCPEGSSCQSVGEGEFYLCIPEP